MEWKAYSILSRSWRQGVSFSGWSQHSRGQVPRAFVASAIKMPAVHSWAAGIFGRGAIVRRSVPSLRGLVRGSRAEVAAPRALAPSVWIAVAWIAAAGGAFAFENEVDPAKIGRGVKAGALGSVVSSAHDAPPVSVWLRGWSDGRPAVGPIDRAHTRAETLPR